MSCEVHVNVTYNAQINSPDLTKKITCFDQFWPSIQSQLLRRTCTSCGKYFSCLKYLTAHGKLHRNLPTVKKTVHQRLNEISEEAPRKSRPKRIAAIRATEVLAIMSYDLNMEDAEWWEKEELDLSSFDVTNFEENKNIHRYETISVEQSLSSRFVEIHDDSSSDSDWFHFSIFSINVKNTFWFYWKKWFSL